MKNVNLEDIRLFVIVVQAGSLTRASELTGITISRLSRRLTELEQALGTQLLNRGKRGVSLNELGKHFFEHGQAMIQQAEQALESVHANLVKPSGLLRISVAGDIYHDIIAPILSDYLYRYPDVQLDIHLTHQKISMIQDGFDIAIRAGAVENELVVAKSITDLYFGVFASVDYLQQYGMPQTPNELYQHRLIAQSLTLPWRFEKAQQQIEIMPMSKVTGNDFTLVKSLIHQGVGIGVLCTSFGGQSEGIVPILTDWTMPKSTLSLLYYKNRGAMPAVRSFVEWLANKLEK